MTLRLDDMSNASNPMLTNWSRLEKFVRAIDREQVGLTQAVRHARARGYTWARIGATLGVSRQVAQQRFGDVDEELRSRGQQLSDDEIMPVEEEAFPVQNPPRHVTPPPDPTSAVEPEPVFDFSALNTMPVDEIVAMADELPKDGRLYSLYQRRLREAIVVTLYKRDISQPKIAAIIGRSSQRVSQLVADYYDRLERVWAAERAQWHEGE